MNKCKDCKFWDRENKNSEVSEEMKFCNLQTLTKALFWVVCGEATFHTAPNFGCIQFEEIGSDESNA